MCQSVKNIVSVFFLFSISLSQRDFDDELKYKTESIETLKKEIMDLQGKIKKNVFSRTICYKKNSYFRKRDFTYGQTYFRINK